MQLYIFNKFFIYIFFFRPYLEKELAVPQERVHQQVDVLIEHGQLIVNQLRRLFLIENITDSAKVFCVQHLHRCDYSCFLVKYQNLRILITILVLLYLIISNNGVVIYFTKLFLPFISRVTSPFMEPNRDQWPTTEPFQRSFHPEVAGYPVTKTTYLSQVKIWKYVTVAVFREN